MENKRGGVPRAVVLSLAEDGERWLECQWEEMLDRKKTSWDQPKKCDKLANWADISWHGSGDSCSSWRFPFLCSDLEVCCWGLYQPHYKYKRLQTGSKPEQTQGEKKIGHRRDPNSAHLVCKDPSCSSDIISQRSSVVTERSHTVKADRRDPSEPITWENIFSVFAFYSPAEGVQACLCCGEAVAKETQVSQTSSIPSYFWPVWLFFCMI